MQTHPTSNRKQPANPEDDSLQQPSCPATPSPLLKQLNTNTLAVLMFIGFALLSSTRGKESEETHVTPTTTDKVGVVNNTHYATSPVRTESKTRPTPEPLILPQLVGWIFSAFKGAFNDPALAQYAEQQGIDTSANQETPCSSAPGQSSNSFTWNGRGFRRVTAEQKVVGNKMTANR